MYTAVILYDKSRSYPKILRPNNAASLLDYSRPKYNKRTKKTTLWYYTTVARYQVRGDEVNVLASRNQKSAAGSSINLFRI